MKLMNRFRRAQPQEHIHKLPPRKAVVALGGGGARGLTHLGTVQAIGESGVQIERIVGVSMGSLAGALCASVVEASHARAKTIQLLHSPIFQKRQQLLFGAKSSDDHEASGISSWFRRAKKYLQAHRRLSKAVTSPALMSDIALQEAIDCLLPDIDIQDLPIPLSIVAVDLLSGQRVILENGSLRKAVPLQPPYRESSQPYGGTTVARTLESPISARDDREVLQVTSRLQLMSDRRWPNSKM